MIETRTININGVPTKVKWDTVLDGPCFEVPPAERETAPTTPKPAKTSKPRVRNRRPKASTRVDAESPTDAQAVVATTDDALPGDTEPAS